MDASDRRQAFNLAVAARAVSVPPLSFRQKELAERRRATLTAALPPPAPKPPPQTRTQPPAPPLVPAPVPLPGVPEMPAQIKSLAEVLQSAQDALKELPAVAQEMSSNVADLVDTAAAVKAVSAEVRKHTAGLKAILGGITNGGPPMEPEA